MHTWQTRRIDKTLPARRDVIARFLLGRHSDSNLKRAVHEQLAMLGPRKKPSPGSAMERIEFYNNYAVLENDEINNVVIMSYLGHDAIVEKGLHTRRDGCFLLNNLWEMYTGKVLRERI